MASRRNQPSFGIPIPRGESGFGGGGDPFSPGGGAGSGSANAPGSGSNPPGALTYVPPGPFDLLIDVPMPPAVPVYTGGAPTSWTVAPAFPLGITLDPALGIISGTPTELKVPIVHVVTGSNVAGSASAFVQIGVSSSITPPSGLSYAPAGPYVLMVGQAISPLIPSLTGSQPFAWTSSPALPPGLVLEPNTGVISGTPAQAQAASPVTITATNAAGSTSIVLSIEVQAAGAPPTGLSYPAAPPLITGQAMAPLVPTVGGGAPTAYTSFPVLETTFPGLSLDPVSGIISGTPAMAMPLTTIRVTAANSAGSTFADVPLQVSDLIPPPSGLSYTPSDIAFLIFVPGQQALATVSGQVDAWSITPSLPPGVFIDSGGTIRGTPTAYYGPTAHLVTASNSSGFTTAGIVFSVVPQAPVNLSYPSATLNLTRGVEMTPISATFTGDPSTVTFSVTPALPAGLGISAATGMIAGTPTAISSAAPFVVRCANISGFVEFTLTITVGDSAPTSISYTPNPATFVQGTAITPLVPTVLGGMPTSWSLDVPLPAGLALNATDGMISGLPTALETAVVHRITGTNAAGSAFVDLTLTITAAPSVTLDYFPGQSPPGHPADRYSFTVGQVAATLQPQATGGAPSSYAISPSLPAGLALSTSTGFISGTPTATSAIVTYTITATFPSTQTAQTTIQLATVSAAPSVLSYPSVGTGGSVNNPIFTKGVSVGSYTPTVTGTATSWTLAGTLPAGLVFSRYTGIISGTPTANQTAGVSVTITAANSVGSVAVVVLVRVYPTAPSNLAYPQSSYSFPVGVAIAPQTPTVTGELLTFSAAALPAGLAINPSSGTINGTPSQPAGATIYNPTATNIAGATSQALTITITTGAPTGLAYTPDRFPSSNAVNVYDFTVGTIITPLVPSFSGSIDLFTISPALPNSAAGGGVPFGIPAVVAPVNAGAPIDFTPNLNGKPGVQEAYIYLPPGTTPADGWPVLFYNKGGGFSETLSMGVAQLSQTVDRIAHWALDHGFAIVAHGATGSVGNLGLWYRTGTAKYDDLNYDNPEKDAEFVVQWARAQTTYPLRTALMGSYGNSSGAHIYWAAALGANRNRLGPPTQVTLSTRLAFMIVGHSVTWYPAVDQTGPTAGPGTHFDRGNGTAGAILGDIPLADLQISSLIGILQEDANAQNAAATTKLCLAYDEAVTSTNFAVSGPTPGYPTLFDTLDYVQGGMVHDSWHGIMLFKTLKAISGASATFHAANSVFAIATTAAQGPPNDDHTATFTGVVNPPSASLQTIIQNFLTQKILASAGPSDGLHIDAATGVISGTPNTVQAATVFTVTGSNSAGNTTKQFTLSVAGVTAPTGFPIGLVINENEHFGRQIAFAKASDRLDNWRLFNPATGQATQTLAALFPFGNAAWNYPDFSQLGSMQAYAAMMNSMNGHYPAGTSVTPYVVTWEGGSTTGNVNLFGPAVTALVSSTTQRKTYTIDPALGTFSALITASPAADPVRNVRVWLPGLEGSTNPWFPGFLTKLSQFRGGKPAALRMGPLDQLRRWGAAPQANQQPKSQDFAQRSTPSHASQAWFQGACLEYQIDICNRTGSDLWIQLPHPASLDDATYDAYIRSTATVVLNGANGFSGLAAGLNVILEWSNETWNTGYPVFNWLNGKVTTAGGTRALHQVAYTLRAFDAWESVWASSLTRVKRFVGGQLGLTSFINGILAEFNAQRAGYRIDGLGPAGYFGPPNAITGSQCPNGYLCDANADGIPDNLPDSTRILDDTDAVIDAGVLASIQAHKSVANARGAALWLYEFGDSIQPVSVWAQAAWDAHRLDRLYTIYRHAMNTFAAAGVQHANHQSFVFQIEQPILPQGSWGLWEDMDKTITFPVNPALDEGSPKAKAVYEGFG